MIKVMLLLGISVAAVAEVPSPINKEDKEPLNSEKILLDVGTTAVSDPQIGLQPYAENGNLQGYKCTRIRKGSVYQKAGLRQGDIIHTINHKVMVDSKTAKRLVRGLKRAPYSEVLITRDGESKKLIIKNK